MLGALVREGGSLGGLTGNFLDKAPQPPTASSVCSEELSNTYWKLARLETVKLVILQQQQSNLFIYQARETSLVPAGFLTAQFLQKM